MPKISLSRFLQLRTNFFLFSFLPLELSFLYLRVLGWFYYAFLNASERRKISENISMVFKEELTAGQLSSLIKKTIANTMAHYAEKLFQVCRSYDKVVKFLRTRVKFQGLELLDAGLARGKGVLLVTGHFGAVEFLPWPLALRGYPVTMLTRFKTDELRTKSMGIAARTGFTLLDCDAHQDLFRATVKHLKEGRALIVECDECDNWRPIRHASTEFLGQRVKVDRTLDLMVKKSSCSVLAAFVCRRKRNHYTLEFREVAPAENKEGVGELLLKILEDYIYTYPEQWYHWGKYDAMLAREGEPDAGQRSHHLTRENPAAPSANA